MRYDLQTGTPEIVAPHVELNVPVCWGPFTKASGGVDCFWEPYASETPAAICEAAPEPNCHGIPLEDRLAAGLSYPSPEGHANEALGNETFGAFLRPRSSGRTTQFANHPSVSGLLGIRSMVFVGSLT